MADDSVEIDIKGDSSSYQKAAGKAKTSTDNLYKATISGSKLMAGAMVALSGVITNKLIAAYTEQEQAELRTKQTLESTGYAAGLTSKELFNMASSLQEVTTYGDEAIISGQNLLLTFKNIGAETFPRATEAMLDMSTAMGTDLKSSAIQVGKALNDPTTGLSMLSRVGITFTAQQKEMIKGLQQAGKAAEAQAIILEELESQFGGAARAAAEGTGQFQQIANIIGDSAEKMGGAITSLAANLAVKFDLKGVAEYWDSVLKGSIDGEKSAAQLTAELENVNQKIKEVSINQQKGAGEYISWFYNLSGEYEKDAIAYADLSVKKGELAKQLAAVEKEEYKNSDEFKAEILRKQLDGEKNIKLTARDALESELAALDDEYHQSDMESRAARIEELITAEEEEKERKLIDKAIELESQGKHLEAIALLGDAARKKEKKALEAQTKVVALSEKERSQLIQSSLSQISALQNSSNAAAVIAGKAAGIANVIISTQIGAMKAFELGPIIGPPLAAGVITAGALSAATIAGVKGFADGGVIGGVNGASVGSDDQFATVKTGEVVLNAEQQQRLLDIANGVSVDSEQETTGDYTDININFNAGAFMDALETEIVTARRENRTAI